MSATNLTHRTHFHADFFVQFPPSTFFMSLGQRIFKKYFDQTAQPLRAITKQFLRIVIHFRNFFIVSHPQQKIFKYLFSKESIPALICRCIFVYFWHLTFLVLTNKNVNDTSKITKILVKIFSRKHNYYAFCVCTNTL